jgi:hypothetical protein
MFIGLEPTKKSVHNLYGIKNHLLFRQPIYMKKLPDAEMGKL